jgi:voltage-gated potassium channel
VPSLKLTFDRAPSFVVLLALIILELMLAPLFAGSEFGVHTAQGLASFILVAALWAAGAHATGVLLFVPTILAQLLAVYWGGAPLHVAALTLRVLFFGYTTGLIMWRTLRESEVTIDTIAGAACVYTLLALVWGNLYMLLEFFHPGSFQIPAAWRMGPEGDPGPALVYFSFVTLTTVGYGDITPLWPGAGGLAAAEAVVGQLYLAVTIARLVGLHASRHG